MQPDETGVEIRFLLFVGCVKTVSPISSNMYRNHAVLKRPARTMGPNEVIQYVSTAAGYAQQLKILEDMFVVRVL